MGVAMKIRLSLRWKILLFAVLNLALLGLAFLVFVRLEFNAGMESFLLAPTETKLRFLAERVVLDLMDTPREQRDSAVARIENENGVQLGLYINTGEFVAGSRMNPPPEVFRRMIPGGSKKKGSPRVGPPLPKRGSPEEIAQKKKGPAGPRHPIFVVANSEGYWFGLRVPIPAPDEEMPLLGTLIVRTSSIILNPYLFDVRPWIIGSLLVFAITVACWFPFIRSMTRSIRQMTAGAEQIAQGRFDVRLPTARGDEIGQLSDALNRMANQLNGLVYGQKRFLGDVAHELSAPLARLNVSLEILQERVEGPGTRYVEGALSETGHMSQLVHELLHFSKAGLAVAPPERSPVTVSEIVGRVLDREAPGNGDVRLVEGGDLKMVVDVEGIYRALSNLVRNAVRYAGNDGPIMISARREQEHVLLTVGDHGPGLPEEALDQVFTPFYRVENSRSRESGGTGLGMAIVRACVESSGGTVWCRNREPKGLEVTVRLIAA
jgi:two-component system sensor histidine kinase CpxA